MLHTPLDFRIMYTRSRFLENSFPRKANTNYSHLEKAIFESGMQVSNTVEEKYIDLCESWKSILKSLEVLYANNQYGLLESSVERIVSNVIPSIRETKECISFINNLNIGDINKDRLIECVKMYKSIDRIKKNHKMLTERFNIDSIFENRSKSFRHRILSICEAIDTYKLSPFIKMNIALEEIKLLDFRHGIKLDESLIVENVLDYFLLRASNTEKDIESYKRAINESKVISEDGISSIQYFIKDSNNVLTEYGLMTWRDKLNAWKMSVKESPIGLIDILKENLYNRDAVYETVKTLSEFDRYETGFSHSYTYYISCTNEDQAFTNEEYESIVEAYDKLLKDGIIKEDKNIDSYREIYSIISEGNILFNESNTKYDPDKVYIDGDDDPEEPVTFTSDKFDSFKLHGLISDAQTVGKLLDQMDESSFVKEFNLVKDNRHIDSEVNMNNYKDYLSESGRFYYTCRRYDIPDGSDMYSIHQFARSMCKCIGNVLSSNNSGPYITVSEHSISFGISSKYNIILSLNESENCDTKYPKSDQDYIDDILLSEHMISYAYDKLPLQEIYDKLHDRNYAGEVSYYSYTIISEALIMIGAKDLLNEFTELCRSECNDYYDRMKNYYENIQLYTKDISDEMSLSVYYETMEYLGKAMGLIPIELNEAFNLNDLRLAWQAFKTKAKHFSAKEKEMSRDVDAVFNNLLKSLKATFTVDHREQIIKGQVTPSLSRMLKIGIGLAGLGLATSNPYIPALAAVAGLAMSKHVSNKEKAMILDEIDIELQVLDREIQKAESGGSPRKYRELLTIQKNLQRERQRIYYGLSSKGKRIPMPSTIGQRRIDNK